MKNLSNIKGIGFKCYIQPDYLPTQRDLHNFFRTFKPQTEYVEDNHFYSPFFARGDIIRMCDNYGDRINPLNCIWQEIKNKRCLNMRLEYDFRFAAVNEEYCMDGEFIRILYKIENACKGTNLYIVFMVSHFNQLVGKPSYMETEHYHILLCASQNKEKDVKQFIYNMQNTYMDTKLYWL